MSGIAPSGDLRNPDNAWGALFSGLAPGFAAADAATPEEDYVDEEDAIETQLTPGETVGYSADVAVDFAEDASSEGASALKWVFDNRTAIVGFIVTITLLYLLNPVLSIVAAVVD